VNDPVFRPFGLIRGQDLHHEVIVLVAFSVVGLAKIAKELHVPAPGRGYWAKGPMERKQLKEPLPWVRPFRNPCPKTLLPAYFNASAPPKTRAGCSS